MPGLNTWRFPVLFGSFLAFAAVGLSYREKLFPDMEAERQKFWADDPTSRKLLQETIEELKKKNSS